MERIVALVEGHTEFHFIRSIYANAIVQRPFPNGDAVSIKLIIESIIDALETVGGNITKVVIMLDREKRAETAEAIKNEILQGLAEKISRRSIYIALADRQIENWIMADENFIRHHFEDQSYCYVGDGTSGKAHLQKICQKVSRSPRDKADLLKRCSALRISGKSPSFKSFANQVDFDWAWING